MNNDYFFWKAFKKPNWQYDLIQPLRVVVVVVPVETIAKDAIELEKNIC
jgi:hypothetical protein